MLNAATLGPGRYSSRFRICVSLIQEFCLARPSTLVRFALADWFRACSYVGHIPQLRFKLQVHGFFVAQ